MCEDGKGSKDSQKIESFNSSHASEIDIATGKQSTPSNNTHSTISPSSGHSSNTPPPYEEAKHSTSPPPYGS